MTVVTTNSSSPRTGNGAATQFPFSFAARSPAEVQVSVNGVVQTAGFTVALASDFNSGTVTFAVPPASGTAVLISSNPSFTQQLRFENAGSYNPAQVDEAIDEAAIRDIYLNAQIQSVAQAAASDIAQASSALESAVLFASGGGTRFYRNKAAALADFANIPNGSFVSVLADETKQESWSFYNKAFNSLEYLSSLSSTQDRRPTVSGVFFDSTAGDTFNGPKISIPSDPSLTVNAGSIAFNSSSALALDLKVKRSDGSILDWANDNFTVDATFTWQSFPAADATGVFVGALNDTLGLYASELKASTPDATKFFARLRNAGSTLVNQTTSALSFTPGVSIRVRYIKVADLITAIFGYTSGDTTLTLNQIYTTSFEAPRMFSAPLIRFVEGNFTLTALKVTANIPNAKFSFVGDSITQGRLGTSYQDGFATKIRADYPGAVDINGAPSGNIGDWLTNIQDVVTLNPKYCFVLLGTNDDTNNVAMATREANYTTLMNSLIAGGIVPIALSVLPKGSSNVPIFNSWLAAQGWRYIDIYTPLLGTGTSMNAAYTDDPSKIHPNTAGHAVIYSTIKAYIVAQGLA